MIITWLYHNLHIYHRGGFCQKLFKELLGMITVTDFETNEKVLLFCQFLSRSLLSGLQRSSEHQV